MVEVLKHCIEQKRESFEFLGFSMPWKRDWTPLVRPHVTMWVMRPTWRGRAAYLARGWLRPRLAQIARRLRREKSP